MYAPNQRFGRVRILPNQMRALERIWNGPSARNSLHSWVPLAPPVFFESKRRSALA